MLFYKMVQNCCNKTLKNKGKCIRKTDNKTFKLPRKFRRSKCLKGVKGFTMRSSCAPFKDCKKSKIKVIKKGGTKQKKYRAVCVLHPNKNNVTGVVKFSQTVGKKRVKVQYEIKGLKDGEHGFHVHECGDLTSGCTSACAHFNPFNTNHGGRKSKERHVGDLGNIKSKNGVAQGSFYDKIISLDYKSKCCIIGRAIVVHADRDDLGKGGDEESLKTGNAGARVGCGIIGIKN